MQSPEEEEDFRVLPTDNLLAIGKAEEDYSSVEVHSKNNSHHCAALVTLLDNGYSNDVHKNLANAVTCMWILMCADMISVHGSFVGKILCYYM